MFKTKILRLSNDDRQFYQWDTERKLIVNDNTCDKVYFSNDGMEMALTCNIYEVDGVRMVNVPNIILQDAKPLKVHLSMVDNDGRLTTYYEAFHVAPRKKPNGYVYTETEVLNYAYLDERLKELEGEGLANAVADYLEKNHPQAGATEEESAQIQQNKADIETLSREKLDASELPEAVNDALAQAKASGEFNGEPGKTPVKGVDYFDGKDYVLTDTDKTEIAELAAEMVEVPEGGSGVTDEQIAQAVEEYLVENPIKIPEGSGNNEALTELNNPITDIIGTAVANAYTGKLTHKCVTDTATVYNGGMLCNNPPGDGVLVGETKFNSSGDVRTETAGNVNVRWVTIKNGFGGSDFTFTSGDDVEIFAPSGEITRVDGTVVKATTGGFGDQILHDTTNNKYIVIGEAFVGSENVVFARVTTAESANAAPSMEFSEAKELTLTVDGVAYNIQNGLQTINSDYDSVSQYNGDVAYENGMFYWVLTNNYKGWIVLTSADGQNWEFNRYIVPDKGAENLHLEAAIGYCSTNGMMLIAGRTKHEAGYMVLTAISDGGYQCTKLIPDCRIGSKPSIARHNYCFYVGHNIGNRSDYELLFVNCLANIHASPIFSTMDIWRVNAWHGVSTQYATIRIGKGASHYGYVGLSGKVGYASLLHCYGMDGNQFARNGASFTYDAFEYDALTVKSGNTVHLENAYYDKGLQLGASSYELPIASAEKLGGVKPVSATSDMTQAVGVDAEGRLFTEPSEVSSEDNVVNPIIHELDVVNGSKALQALFDGGTLVSNAEATAHGGCLCHKNMIDGFLMYTQNNVGTSVDYGNGSGSCSVDVRSLSRKYSYPYADWTYGDAVQLFKAGDDIYDNDGANVINQMIDAGDASCAYFNGNYYLCAMANITSGSYGEGRFPVTRNVSTTDTTGIDIGNGYYAGIAKAWSLTIDGVKGDFDFRRVNPAYKKNPQTNFETCYNNGCTKLLAPVVCDGKAVCIISTTNMLDWTLEATYEYEHGHLEAAMICGGWRGFIVAVRTQIGVTHIMVLDGNLTLNAEYDLASGEGRPCFATHRGGGQWNNNRYWKLFVNEENRNVMTAYQIHNWDTDSCTFVKIGSWKNNICNYLNVSCESADYFFAIGTNGSVGDKAGISVVEFTSSAFTYTAPDVVNGEDGGYYTPVVTKLNDTTVEFAFTPSKEDMPAVESVEVTLPIGSGGGGSDVWEHIETYTVTDGETSHKTELSKKYKKFYIYMDSVYASGNSKFRVMADYEAVTWNGRILAQVDLTNSQYKYSNIEIEKIASNRIVTRQSNQGANLSTTNAFYWNVGQEKMAEEFLYFGLATDGVTLTGGRIEIFGVPA